MKGRKQKNTCKPLPDSIPLKIQSPISKDPVTIPNLHATIHHALGIPPNHGYEVEKRPFYVTADGKGRAVRELFG